VSIRGRGINYDTGFSPAWQSSRPHFDPAQVERELQVIAQDLHCTCVRITGADPERIETAAQLAAAAGLEVWFAPFPCELSREDTRDVLLDCADRAEKLRQSGAAVVLVTGCELSLFGAGFAEGVTFAQRIPNLFSSDLDAICAELSEYLGTVATQARERFGGKITYAAGQWEDIDWTPFDIVSVDGYRDAANKDYFPALIQGRFQDGKPVAITEFGCCTYAGAAGKGGMGWAIIDYETSPARLDGDYARDEDEQVRYLNDLLTVFDTAGVDTAFWFTFAGYNFPHRDDPRADLDLASYGLVAISDDQGTTWQPKKAYHALAAAYSAYSPSSTAEPGV
jgi:hypothetical protein